MDVNGLLKIGMMKTKKNGATRNNNCKKIPDSVRQEAVRLLSVGGRVVEVAKKLSISESAVKRFNVERKS